MSNDTTPEIDKLGTATDVAEYAKCSISWVHKAAGRGELPCIRVGAMLRFDMAAVKKFFADRAVPAGR